MLLQITVNLITNYARYYKLRRYDKLRRHSISFPFINVFSLFLASLIDLCLNLSLDFVLSYILCTIFLIFFLLSLFDHFLSISTSLLFLLQLRRYISTFCLNSLYRKTFAQYCVLVVL